MVGEIIVAYQCVTFLHKMSLIIYYFVISVFGVSQLICCLENVAVVEHSPKKNDDPIQTIKENIDNYRLYMEEIKDLNVDVIVFPEYGLTGYVKDVENYAININKSQVITELSHMSAEYSINMVVNLLEKIDDDIFYNTNLVFNKKGEIIARYRKININPATETKLTAGAEGVEFMLEGKQFSTITNDDILFDYPTQTFSGTVSHVAIPMNWRNLRPFNTATSIQAAYGIKTNKVVLAANLNDVDKNITGCGIYSRDLNEIFISGDKSSEVITSYKLLRKKREHTGTHLEQIPLNMMEFISSEHSKQWFNLTLKEKLSYEELHSLTTGTGGELIREKRQTEGTNLDKLPLGLSEFISSSNENQWYDLTFEAKLQNKDQHCSIYFPMIDEGLDPLLPWGVLSSYKEVDLNGRLYNIRMCAYIACDTQFDANFELMNCGRRYKNQNVTFQKVEMRTNLDFAKSMPTTLDYDLKPLRGVTWKEVDGNIEMKVDHISQMLNIFAIVEFNPIKTNPPMALNRANQLKIENIYLILIGLKFAMVYYMKIPEEY